MYTMLGATDIKVTDHALAVSLLSARCQHPIHHARQEISSKGPACRGLTAPCGKTTQPIKSLHTHQLTCTMQAYKKHAARSWTSSSTHGALPV